MHLRRLNKCAVILFITAYNTNKSENEERKTTKYLQFTLSSPVSAILGNALFTCKARSDWLVPVPQRLI